MGLISSFSQLLWCVICLSGWVSMCCLRLDICNMPVLRAKFPSRNKTKQNKEVNWNDLNFTGCRGPLISMLFLPSVNLDYGEMPVMALLSFLSFPHSLWLRGVGGVEVLIGNCRAHCLQIHGFSDWPASGFEIHQHTHASEHMHVHTHHIHTCIWCTETQPNQSAFWNHHIYV